MLVMEDAGIDMTINKRANKRFNYLGEISQDQYITVIHRGWPWVTSLSLCIGQVLLKCILLRKASVGKCPEITIVGIAEYRRKMVSEKIYHLLSLLK